MKRALILAGLLGLSLFGAPLRVHAAELRSFGFSRLGNPVPWSGSQKGFPKVHWDLDPEGTLSIAKVGLAESLYPYDFDDGHHVQRPAIIDDLFYESLMVPDPVGDGETLYPLIATSVRHPADFSSILFELDPAAEFNDGAPVRPDDILFSYTVFLKHDPKSTAELAKLVKDVRVEKNGVRFELDAQGQTARDAIMKLAQMKIVRSNRRINNQLGGVKVPFLGTGPYLIGHLGRTQIFFVRNLFYWGSTRPTRRGFFNFLQIDVNLFPDDILARNSIASGETHIFEEYNPLYIDHTLSQTRKKNLPVESREEKYKSWGQPLNSWVFNLDRPQLQDVRVRQALILAFDFDQMNGLYFGGHKIRPLSYLHESLIAPSGLPDFHTKAALAKCGEIAPKNAYDAFESYGQIGGGTGNHRMRLLKAQSLLFEAGYKLSNGRMVSGKDNRQLALSFIVRDDLELQLVNIFEKDLTRMGISVAANKVSDARAFEDLLHGNTYDVASTPQVLLTRDGWPHVDFAMQAWHSSSANPLGLGSANPNRLRSVCIDRLIEDMAKLEPLTAEYRGHAQALARLQQALALNIFTGELKQRHFLLDNRIRIPSDLSAKKAHMYGFWAEKAGIEQNSEGSQEGAPMDLPRLPCEDMTCLVE